MWICDNLWSALSFHFTSPDPHCFYCVESLGCAVVPYILVLKMSLSTCPRVDFSLSVSTVFRLLDISSSWVWKPKRCLPCCIRCHFFQPGGQAFFWWVSECSLSFSLTSTQCTLCFWSPTLIKRGKTRTRILSAVVLATISGSISWTHWKLFICCIPCGRREGWDTNEKITLRHAEGHVAFRGGRKIEMMKLLFVNILSSWFAF